MIVKTVSEVAASSQRRLERAREFLAQRARGQRESLIEMLTRPKAQPAPDRPRGASGVTLARHSAVWYPHGPRRAP